MHPILFEAGRLTVYAYGVFVALGFATAWWLARGEAERAGVESQHFRDVSLLVILAALVGGHAAYRNNFV